MSEHDLKQLESEIEKRVEGRLNERELKKIRYQLEEMNRVNADEHKLINFNVEKIAILQRKHDESIEKLANQNWWILLIDWLASLIKKKESYIFPAIIAIIAWWNSILELIKSLIP